MIDVVSSASSVNAIHARCSVIVGYEFEKATTLKYDRRSLGRAWPRRSAAVGTRVQPGDRGRDRDSGKTMRDAAKRKMSSVLSSC